MRELIQHIRKKVYSNFISQIHNVNNLMPAISNDSSNKYMHSVFFLPFGILITFYIYQVNDSQLRMKF